MIKVNLPNAPASIFASHWPATSIEIVIFPQFSFVPCFSWLVIKKATHSQTTSIFKTRPEIVAPKFLSNICTLSPHVQSQEIFMPLQFQQLNYPTTIIKTSNFTKKWHTVFSNVITLGHKDILIWISWILINKFSELRK